MLQIHLTLISDASFGRGDGVAGLVDEEVEHDEFGLPYVRGRTLKGLLVEECANLLYALEWDPVASAICQRAAQWLFGQAGSTPGDEARMQVGAAVLPADLRAAVEADVHAEPPRVSAADVLESLSAIRRQTAVDEDTGAPDEGSLRSMRVVLRQTPFIARLDFAHNPDADALAVLAACVLSLRRGGTGRNRGRGRLLAQLCDEQGREISGDHLAHLERMMKRGAS